MCFEVGLLQEACKIYGQKYRSLCILCRAGIPPRLLLSFIIFHQLSPSLIQTFNFCIVSRLRWHIVMAYVFVIIFIQLFDMIKEITVDFHNSIILYAQQQLACLIMKESGRGASGLNQMHNKQHYHIRNVPSKWRQ